MEVLFGIIALALTIAMPFMIIVMLVKICCIEREIEAIALLAELGARSEERTLQVARRSSCRLLH